MTKAIETVKALIAICENINKAKENITLCGNLNSAYREIVSVAEDVAYGIVDIVEKAWLKEVNYPEYKECDNREEWFVKEDVWMDWYDPMITSVERIGTLTLIGDNYCYFNFRIPKDWIKEHYGDIFQFNPRDKEDIWLR